MDDLAQQAISQALSGNWQEAVELNELILKSFPENTDALVRLSKAQIELGSPERARKNLEKTLRIDPLNGIAAKLLARAKTAGKAGEITHTKVDPQMFLEEPGKTKLTELTHLGDKGIILQLDPGDEVKLNTGGHTISVSTINDRHIGRIPDNLGFRLKKLVSEGFSYQALVKSADPDAVKVFIRETDRPVKAASVMSFPIERADSEEQVHEESPDDEEY